MVGSLLGDGALRRQGTRTNALFEGNHTYAVKEYVDWKWQRFHEFVRTPPKARRTNGDRVAYRFVTRSLPVFTNYHRWFYPQGRKRIPEGLELEPLLLAVWFMDDGSQIRGAFYLNTQQFLKHEQEFLRDILLRQLQITSALNRDKEYFRLRMTIESTKRMKRLIEPHILSCFRYKVML